MLFGKLIISANDVKRKKSKNISSAPTNNAHTSSSTKNYNLDDWLENSFRNSVINSNSDGYIPPSFNVNSHGSKPVVPEQMHSLYLKVKRLPIKGLVEINSKTLRT